MWIYIADPDESKEPWIGTIEAPEESGMWWSFELIRHVEMADAYRSAPFDGRDTVVGLLDHQQRCTLFRPRVMEISPGSFGVRLVGQRTQIKGKFDALLTELPIEDSNKQVFAGLSFDSEAFGLWYAPPAFSTGFDPATSTHYININRTSTDTYDVPGVGRVSCTTCAQVSPRGRASTIHSAAIFRVDFTSPVSLRELLLICGGVERLFGFLIGFRGKPPRFKAWLEDTYVVGNRQVSHDGVLDVAGADWLSVCAPHPMECVHQCGAGGGTLEQVLERFFRNQDDIRARVHAVEFSRYFSSNLNDRFSIILPVLEGYLKQRYTSADEVSYLASKTAFFDWIEKSGDQGIIVFSRKHINVQKKKSPSLTTLISRAIDFVNSKGFSFPHLIAERLQTRRGRLFHSTSGITEADVSNFYAEVQAAAGLLMLHTYDDLGIDICCLAKRRSALGDLRDFLSRQPLPRPL